MKRASIKPKAAKRLLCLTVVTVLLFCYQATAFAANTNQGPVLTVNTALNAVNAEIAEQAEQTPGVHSPVLEEPEWAWHPISVVNEPMNAFNAIRRTYALPPDVNPAVISTAGFEMFGQQFTFAYVIQQPTSDESFMEMRETVTIEARSRELNDILPNLEREIWYERDGFAGTLALDIHSITSEAAGTARHTSTATRQRTYPHLSSPDNSLIPRTITDRGTTFHLATVDWQSSSVSAVDGHPVASSYTAHATYSAQVTQTRTTGYSVTAEYVGTVFRITQGKTLFTAIFYGEPIFEIWLDEYGPEYGGGYYAGVPEPETLPGPDYHYEPYYYEGPAETVVQSMPNGQNGSYGNGNATIISLAVIGTLIGLAAFGVGGFFFAKYYFGYNVTVFSINGPREIVKAGKIRLDVNSPEPTIILDKAVGQKPAKTDRYIIQIAQRSVLKLVGKTVRVVLRDKEAFHEVPERALGLPIYEFEANFSDESNESDKDVPDERGGTPGDYGPPLGGGGASG